jgi:benzoate membrane transport protein
MAEPAERQAALFALLLAAADVTLLGIGAPFWGLVIGVLTSRLLPRVPS